MLQYRTQRVEINNVETATEKMSENIILSTIQPIAKQTKKKKKHTKFKTASGTMLSSSQKIK